ncbi:MAG: acyl carrier protein [Gemmatimonadales bacterium]
MSDIQSRLVVCFAIAFPEVPTSAVTDASPETVAAWDSIGVIALASVIEEEFAIAFDLERLPDLNSFDAMRRYVEQQVAAPRRGDAGR